MRPVFSISCTVLLALLLAACGDESAPTATTPDVPAWAKVAPEQTAEAVKHGVPVAFENDLGMHFVLIPAGTFLMGSPEDEEGRDDGGLDIDVEKQHEVTISKPYYMQITEVTLGQFRAQEGGHTLDRQSGWEPTEPGFDEARLRWPVVYVSQHDAKRFAESIGSHCGQATYRLPTEAEWEYACRAGGTRAYGYEGALSASKAWIDRKGEKASMTEVARFPPNRWGLFDMHGNALEWCLDTLDPYAETAQVDPLVAVPGRPGVARGGAYNQGLAQARCAARCAWPDNPFSGQIGFRLVSPLPEPGALSAD